MSRRRVYLMRHAEVRYFGGVQPEDVSLTETGRAQALAAQAALRDVAFDRVVTSGLRRAVETAGIVAPGRDVEHVRDLREIEAGRLRDIPEPQLERTFTSAFRGEVPRDARFLGGETIGELVDRVHGALDRLLDAGDWDVALLVLHGGVNRAILSRALTGRRVFLGGFEQAPGCVNVLDTGAGDDWIVRAVNHTPYDPAHLHAERVTTMEALYAEFVGSRTKPAPR